MKVREGKGMFRGKDSGGMGRSGGGIAALSREGAGGQCDWSGGSQGSAQDVTLGRKLDQIMQTLQPGKDFGFYSCDRKSLEVVGRGVTCSDWCFRRIFLAVLWEIVCREQE